MNLILRSTLQERVSKDGERHLFAFFSSLLVPGCVNCRMVPSPPRKRGARKTFEVLALDARFRGYDEKSPITYANFCKEIRELNIVGFGSRAGRGVGQLSRGLRG